MNSQNIIIVIILVIIFIPAVKNTITHMKGEGACCGGPKEKPKETSGKTGGKADYSYRGNEM